MLGGEGKAYSEYSFLISLWDIINYILFIASIYI